MLLIPALEWREVFEKSCILSKFIKLIEKCTYFFAFFVGKDLDLFLFLGVEPDLFLLEPCFSEVFNTEGSSSTFNFEHWVLLKKGCVNAINSA